MTLIAFIIVLGILVLVHEWGHFIVARKSGVRVEVFSIGFGPALARLSRGGTEYKIAAIPLGGYVKMAGDQPGEDGAEAPDGYLAQPRWKRAAIVLAGPAMNMVLALVLAPVIYMVGVPEPTHWEEPARIGWVAEAPEKMDMGPVDRLPPGARITAVEESSIETWRQLQTALSVREGEVPLRYRMPAGAVSTVVLRQPEPGALLAVLLPPMPPVIHRVMDGSAADAAGLEPADRIVGIGGEPVEHWMEIRRLTERSGGEPVTVAVEREAERIVVSLTPRYDETSERHLIGIARQESREVRQYGVVDSFGKGFERVGEMVGLTFKVLKDLVTGELGLKALGGPVMIAQGAGDAARAGLGAFLNFMVFISIQLAVLNMLPIPVLDGGHLFVMGIETVIRRPLPDRWVELAQWMGLGLLILLMLYVTRNDILRFWGESLRGMFGVSG